MVTRKWPIVVVVVYNDTTDFCADFLVSYTHILYCNDSMYLLESISICPLVSTSKMFLVFCTKPKHFWIPGWAANKLNLLVQILVFGLVGNARQMPAFVLSADLLSFVPRSGVIAWEYDLVRVFAILKNCWKNKTKIFLNDYLMVGHAKKCWRASLGVDGWRVGLQCNLKCH